MAEWGGARPGAGRKKGSSSDDIPKTINLEKNHGGVRPKSGPKAKYGEPTKAMRVPASMQQSVLHYIENKGYNLPVYTMRVPMGAPKMIIDNVERTLNLNELVRNPYGTFFHPVEGDSMEPTVSAGDLAMIDTKVEPMHNDVVLALIDGNVTLKRLMKKNNKIWLEPDNKTYPHIKLDPDGQNFICGVMLFAIRPVSLNHVNRF
jgi:DNA polymerase V